MCIRDSPESLQGLEWKDLAAREILQLHRTMTALDDGGGAVVFADSFMKRREITAIAFGDQDMRRAAQMGRWLSKSASGKEKLISERRLTIDQDDVMTAMKFQVLEAVIQDQEIASQRGHGMTATFDPVPIDHNGNTAQILGQHERLISGCLGVKQEGATLGHDTR